MKVNKLVFLMVVVFCFSIAVQSQTKVEITDNGFQTYLSANLPEVLNSGRDSLIVAEAAAITQEIDCSNANIQDISDIQYFTGITNLNCSNNQLTSLPDLSGITNLQVLDCSSNMIDQLPDLSHNTKLVYLKCLWNKLDFSDAEQLKAIDTISALIYYKYLPQTAFGSESTINLDEGDELSISIASQASATGYQWYRGDMQLAGETDTLLKISSIAANQGGNYYCKSKGTLLSAANMNWEPGTDEFISASFIVNIEPIVGLSHMDNKEVFKVFPNPNEGEFQFEFTTGKAGIIEYKVINILGQPVIKKISEVKQTVFSQQVNLQNYPVGVYYLQVLYKNKIHTKKITVK